MAIPSTDVRTGQPVKTWNNGDVVSAICDGTTTTQLLGIDSAGRITIKFDDGNGNIVTSQANGSQRALDVGINVGGVQIDPRLGGQYDTTLPTLTNGQFVAPQTDSSGRLYAVSPTAANFNALVAQGAAGSAAAAWFTTDAADGSVAPGTAGTKSMLGGGIYNSSPITLTTGQQAALQMDAAGNLKVTLSADAVVINTKDSSDGPVAPGTAATTSMLAGMVYNSTAPTPTNGQQLALQSDATGALKTRLLTDTDRVSADLNVAGAPVTPTNPIPVIISSSIPGTPINSYFASTAVVAAGASDTHTYNVTSSKTLNAKKFWASGTGRMRIDVAVVIGGTSTTVFTGFNSASNPNITIDMDEFYVPSTGTSAQIVITRYNEELTAAFGMYSTISGVEN